MWNGDDFQRTVLEARILADQPVEEIAERMQLERNTIATYEALFIDVRPYLRCTEWISQEVLKDNSSWGVNQYDVTGLWRSFAYQYGVEPLEHLLTGVTRAALVADGNLAYLTSEARIPMHLQIAIAWILLPLPNTEDGWQRRHDFHRLEDAMISETPLSADLAASFGLPPDHMVSDEVVHKVRVSELRRALTAA